jgi:5,10-methylenetetrahydromethanopterin reductase
MIWQALGVTQDEFTPIMNAVMRDNDIERGKAMISPQMLRVGIAGTTHDLIERLEALVKLGVKHISFGPPLGYDLDTAVSAIGRDVIPHFRSKA